MASSGNPPDNTKIKDFAEISVEFSGGDIDSSIQSLDLLIKSRNLA